MSRVRYEEIYDNSLKKWRWQCADSTCIRLTIQVNDESLTGLSINVAGEAVNQSDQEQSRNRYDRSNKLMKTRQWWTSSSVKRTYIRFLSCISNMPGQLSYSDESIVWWWPCIGSEHDLEQRVSTNHCLPMISTNKGTLVNTREVVEQVQTKYNS